MPCFIARLLSGITGTQGYMFFDPYAIPTQAAFRVMVI